jgi:hypothetical protein
VRALDTVLGTDASRIKRGEHSFSQSGELEALLREAGFMSIDVRTVTQTLVFPSVLDYVRFQLLASPMTGLVRDYQETERQAGHSFDRV